MATVHPSVQAATELLPLFHREELRELLAYWLSIHPGDRLPGRDSFDPGAVPRLLRHIVLTDVERDPYRFKVRVLGTAVADAFGRDFTGRYMDEVFTGHETSLSHILRVRAVETGLPCLRPAGPGTFPGLEIAPLEGVHLPFASDGVVVDCVLSMFLYVRGTTTEPTGVWHLANR